MTNRIFSGVYKTGTWGEQAKARNQKRLEYFRNYQRQRYRKSREQIDSYRKLWRIQNPEKDKASNLARQRIPIPQNQKCEQCHVSPISHRHHPDYTKPFKVTFLCASCHRKIRQ